MKTVEEILSAYSLAALKDMAQVKGVGGDAKKKEPLVRELAVEIVRKESIARSLSQLDPLARQALDRMVLSGGRLSAGYLEAGLLADDLITPASSGRSPWGYARREEGQPFEKDSTKFEDVVARLTVHGLVLSEAPARSSSSSMIDFRPGDWLFVPEQILPHIPRTKLVVKEVDETGLSRVEEVPLGSFQRDSQLLLSYLGANEVVLTKQGLVPKKSWTSVLQTWVVQEDLTQFQGEASLCRPRFVRLALELTGMVAVAGNRLVLGKEAESILKQSRGARLRKAFLSWIEGQWWDESVSIPMLRTSSSRSYESIVPEVVVAARQFICQLVGSLPHGRWISFDDFERWVRRIRWDFLFPKVASGGSLSYGSRSGPKTVYETLGLYGRTDEECWKFVEARFIASIITGPLFWLGAVSLGYKDAELVALKLTDVGRALLRNETPGEEHEPNRKVILQPNFQLFAFEPMDDHVVFTIGRFAERVRLGPALEFRLTRESVYRAQQRGMVAQDVIAFLQGVSDGPIPQNVHRTLLEWGEQHERIVFRRGVSLCHVADPALLEALMADPDLATCFGRRISDTAAYAAGGNDMASSLSRAMLLKGHLPVLATGDDGNVTSPILTVDEDGRVRFAQKLPSIYVLRRVDRFAEQREGERWITPASIRMAERYGVSIDEIAAQLDVYHGSKAPRDLLTRVRAWAGFFGQAGLGEVTLLKVADAAALQELLRFPRIARLITPFVAEKGLAAVEAHKAQELLAALRDLGIEVQPLSRV